MKSFLPLPLLFAVLCLLSSCTNKEDPGNLFTGAGEPFPLAFYLQSPGGLQGNKYQMKAQIDRQLGWRAGVGKIILVQASTEDGLMKKVPVFFPDEIAATVLPGQKLLLTVLVGEQSLVSVESFEKF